MIAIREEREMAFFQFTTKGEVRDCLREEYDLASGFYHDQSEILDVGDLAGSLMELFVEELFKRQLNIGDVNMFATREECIEAMEDDKKMEEIYAEAHDVISYSGMFGRSPYYMTDFEQDFIDDLVLLLEEAQYVYSVDRLPEEAETGKLFTDSSGRTFEVKNCPLQEVW